jgi:predicted ATPase
VIAPEIIGREDELASIEDFLGRVQEGPGALVLSGEAGIGKKILWEAGVEEARERFSRVLSCRGVEAEASLSFAGLSELLAPVLEETGPSLAPPRRRALEVALLLAEPGEMAPDPHAIGLAVLDALTALARDGPVLIALDDVQWLDPASAGVLQIALRRVREECRATGDAADRTGRRKRHRARPLIPGWKGRAALHRPAQPQRRP